MPKRIFIKETFSKIGERVKVNGWVAVRRDHGKIIFIDLRDASGILQIVFAGENKELHMLADTLRPEWVIQIEGEIKERPPKLENPEIETGKIELAAEKLEIISKAETPPFEIENAKEASEEIRLKYRYLDLRRKKMQENLRLRHRAVKFIRDSLCEKNFIEIETPLLTKSTPEGARDFIVPSRLHPGKFYALPQSPQQYKQLLMVAGFERYFQIARCIRDEDTRGDRQPEFTQLDIEMSFVEQEDVLNLIENLLIDLIKKEFPEKKIQDIPFPRIDYGESLLKYGNDRPDFRKNKNNPNLLAFSWVINFPLFVRDEAGNIASMHHPFTAPQDSDIEKLDSKDAMPGTRAKAYDIVLNGYEIGGGSLRIFQPELQRKIFKIFKYSEEEIEKRFGHLIEAFRYGAPPHGGIALGLDRLAMILAGENSIREVIAFPKTGDGRDLMMNAPSKVDEAQLKELGIKIEKKE